MRLNLSKYGSINVQVAKGTADNEDLTGAGFDMTGYSGVMFIAGMMSGEAGTISLKAQQAGSANFGDAADLVGTATTAVAGTAATGYACAILEIVDPQERYVRPILTVPNLNTANAAWVIGIAYGPDILPVSNSNAELHVSPAEGTA